MVALFPFFCSLLLVSTSTLASPVPSSKSGALKFPTFDPSGLLCQLPIINKLLCPRQGGTLGPSVNTPLGTANGVLDSSGAMRFVVRYGSAQRWGPSSVA